MDVFNSKAEQESSMYETLVHDENETLVELNVGDAIDCIITEMQSPTGRMSSPLLHGKKVIVGGDDSIAVDPSGPFKMWAGASLQHAFKEGTLSVRPTGIPLRIRRLADVQVGSMFQKTYRISNLKLLLSRLAKDRITPSNFLK